MGIISLVLTMIAAVVLSGILVRVLPFAIPTPLVQIAFGALISAASVHAVHLDPEIFFLLFLPPLLFLDGWRIPKEGLLRDRGTIIELAFGLVILTVLGMGFFIHWMIPAMPLAVAFALAAIVSPTDPVAVSAISARVPIPKRLMHVLEGESLLNDASGLVCFRFAVAAVLTGTFSLPTATLTLLRLTFGGIAIGFGVTFVVMRIKNRITRRFGEESGAQVLLSVLIPFAAYQLAEHTDCSGILAAVAAGITMSYIELSGEALGVTRMQRAAMWDTIQFALNGVMFVLLGEQLPSILSGAVDVVQQSNHENAWWLAVYVVVINFGLAALRFVWVWVSLFVAALALRLRGLPARPRPSFRLLAAISVAGPRGAITLAGVLTLPLALADGTEFPARDLAIFLAAGVIILSLLAASIGLPQLLKGVDLPAETDHNLDEDRARVQAGQSAIRAVEARLHELAANQPDADLYAEAANRVMDLYRRRIEGRSHAGESSARARRIDDLEKQLRLAGLRAERDTIFTLARAQRLSDEVSRKVVREIDLLEERLK